MEATDNMKNIWKIIKNITLRNKQNSPTESFVDGKTITDKNAIVQKFNDAYVNIGPTLTIVEYSPLTQTIKSTCGEIIPTLLLYF